ncbi:hypothetical protein [Gordonia rubripertincta]|uniref:Uncharacterized protein n=1 Tax=Gordonia rubripertincta TaxID=36822 RepID=A0ABT4MSX9_GORRU|nr:hypothetical protein [Gordonia rubripertincta]MCZ4550100.1 hypothetical protein [Gordonia rubripertincta]
MRQYLPSIGSAILGLLGVTLGLLPIVDAWPRWLLLAIGVIALLAAAIQITKQQAPRKQSRTRLRQSQTGGKNSKFVQGGGDIHIEGGIGDKK